MLAFLRAQHGPFRPARVQSMHLPDGAATTDEPLPPTRLADPVATGAATATALSATRAASTLGPSCW